MSRKAQKKKAPVHVEEEKNRDEVTAASVLDAFKYFDKNAKGSISTEEFRVILTKLGTPLSPEQINEIFKECEIEEPGMVDYEKFVEFWNSQ